MTAKDVILAIIAKIGAWRRGAHAIEYAGSAIRDMSIEERLTVCNMSIEAGARAGMVAPDETTYAYVEGPPVRARRRASSGSRRSPTGRRCPRDADAVFDKEVDARCERRSRRW